MKNVDIMSSPPANDGNLSMEESNQLLEVYKDTLEVVVTGKKFQFALDSLCKAAEGLLPEALASIMLFNEDRTSLSVRSAPNVPDEAIEQLKGLVPAENSGSCATAVYKGEPQYVFNTLQDPRWGNVRSFAKDYNINACWSMPIINEENQIVGSFALSSFENRMPNDFQENLLKTIAYLTSLVLLREKEEAELQSAAHRDQLTGLPNRLFFNMRVEQAIARAERNKSVFAVFFVDLDDFKIINDEQGHDTGDSVLANIGASMQQCIRKQDTLARFGGDEFVLLVEDFASTAELPVIAQKILDVFQQPISANECAFKVAASIGISLYPQDGKTCKELTRAADQAMYAAKRNALGKIQFYSKQAL